MFRFVSPHLSGSRQQRQHLQHWTAQHIERRERVATIKVVENRPLLWGTGCCTAGNYGRGARRRIDGACDDGDRNPHDYFGAAHDPFSTTGTGSAFKWQLRGEGCTKRRAGPSVH